MGGRLIPDLSFEPAAIHFLHRGLALVTGIVVLAVGLVVVKRKAELPVQTRVAHAAMGLFAVQILIGALNVWNPPPGVGNELLVTTHLLVAAAIWGCLVALSVVSHPSMAMDFSAQGSIRRHPAYEAGA
jgi:heme A synthase